RDRLGALVDERTAELDESYKRLSIAERMAGLGTLSAGLGHDMGNLIMPMRVRLESLEAAPNAAERGEDAKAIRHCLDQLQHLSNGLRLLAVDPERTAADETVDVREWWPDVERLFRDVV